MAQIQTDRQTDTLTPILIAGSFVMLISFGLRASFGVFQVPVQDSFGWPRAEFSMALAIQNLAWGIGQPLFSMIAERFGDRKAIVAGVAVYALGLLVASMAVTPLGQQLSTGVMIGLGVAGTGFGVILAIVGRAAPAEKRSMALGLATAAGSMGQVFVPPIAEALQSAIGWQQTLFVFSGVILLALGALPWLAAPAKKTTKTELEESMGSVLRRAATDPSYLCIFLGFFSCGFQLAFITAHFPAFVQQLCGSSTLGAISLTVIGAANVVGTIVAGKLGGKYSRKYLLSIIYALRTVVAIAFILAPASPVTVIVFSLSMGALWLATVPLTSGLVAYLYGLRYMGTLYGFVFLSHQIGGFLGV